MLTAIQELSTIQIDIDEALVGYLSTALCFTINEDCIGYSVLYDLDDISCEVQADCFVELTKFLYEFRKITRLSYDAYNVGSDFWLSRNSIGEGFNCSVYGGYADALDTLAKSFGKKTLMTTNGNIQFK